MNAQAVYCITGATGLIGQALVKKLCKENTIIACVRNRKKAEKLFSSLPNISIVCADIRDKVQLERPVDYIIHAASITSSIDFLEKPVETIETAFLGTKNILECAKETGAKSIVYLSSMEVFGITDTKLSTVKESDYGYIDILQPRSSYSESKRLCECLCAAYAAEYNLPVKIARLTQVVGPGIAYDDTRVAAYFARCVIENKNIVMKTRGEVTRPLVYIDDAVNAILTILQEGQNGEAYTVANSDSLVSVRDIAEMVAGQIAANAIKVEYQLEDAPEYASNKGLYLPLNTDKLQSLGWKPKVGLEEAYRKMIEAMEAMKEEHEHIA
jgi:dTDP-glucose 4,6-dehydratase